MSLPKILDGRLVMTIQGSRSYVDSQCADCITKGWRMKAYDAHLQWPKFWKMYYVAVLQKDIIVKRKHIIETSLTDIL